MEVLDMAYNAGNEERTELAVVNKNDRGEKIVITKIVNKSTGAMSLDLRNYYTDADGVLRPTQKGIRVRDEIVYEVVKGCLGALDEYELTCLKDYISDVTEEEE